MTVSNLSVETQVETNVETVSKSSFQMETIAWKLVSKSFHSSFHLNIFIIYAYNFWKLKTLSYTRPPTPPIGKGQPKGMPNQAYWVRVTQSFQFPLGNIFTGPP